MSVSPSTSATANFLAAFAVSEPPAGSGSPLSPTSPASGTTSTPPTSMSSDMLSYPHCPVYIPSLGRADQERGTMALLVKDLVPFTVVVEPHEAAAYRQLIDHTVFRCFGAAGMVFPTDGADDVTTAATAEGGRGGAPPTPASCVCCMKARQGTSDRGIMPAGEVAPTPGASPAVWARRQRIAKLYHHGYTVNLPDNLEDVEGGEGGTKRELCTAKTGAATTATDTPRERVASPDFTLKSVDDVSALFRVAALPESGQGVSYVRNYILQVLVPQDMVAAGVDRSGHVDELDLFDSTPAGAGGGVAAPASKAYLQEAQLRSLHVSAAADGSAELAAATAAVPDLLLSGGSGGGGGGASSALPSAAEYAPHILYGYYWVMDDDISAFFHAQQDGGEEGKGVEGGGAPGAAQAARRNVRVSAREVMRQTAARVEVLHRRHVEASASGGSSSSSGGALPLVQRPLSSFMPHGVGGLGYGTAAGPGLRAGGVFTCKEDCLANNPQQVKRVVASGGGGGIGSAAAPVTQLNTGNYTYLPQTACIALEYSRFAYSYDDTALAVNSYANIACLFNYALLHSPRVINYFPPNVPLPGIRSASDVLGCGIAFSPLSLNPAEGDTAQEESGEDGAAQAVTNRGSSTSMLWYRFTVREDYDFSLQLIARGLCTLRLRNLSFDVPQMAKLRGGMTDFYKSRADHIQRQNELFVRQWPAVAMPWMKGRNSTEREDIKVAWGALLPGRSRHPGAFLFLAEPLPQIREQATIQKLMMQRQQQQQQVEQEEVRDTDGGGGVATGAPTHPTASDARQPQPQQQQQPQELLRGPSAPHDPTPDDDAPARTAGTSHVTWRGKRHWGSDTDETATTTTTSDSSSSSEGEGESQGGGGVRREHPYPPPHHPPLTRRRWESETAVDTATSATARPLEALAPLQRTRGEDERAVAAHVRRGSGWKGYAVERWRDVSTAEAARLGLQVMPLAAQRVGVTVAVIPPSFAHHPSCVLATLVERQTNSATGQVEWTAAAQRARGIPLLSVAPDRVFEPPEVGVAEVAAAIDDFFSGSAVPGSASAQERTVAEGAGGSASWLDDA